MIKKVALGVLVGVLAVGTATLALAHPFGWGPNPQGTQAAGGGWGPGFGPMSMMGTGFGMGPGMMGMTGRGFGMGPGMMGSGSGPGAAGFTPPCAQSEALTQGGQPVTKDVATQTFQGYVARIGNPNLKLGDVTETDAAFEGKVVTKDGSLVQKLIVEKATGRVHQAY